MQSGVAQHHSCLACSWLSMSGRMSSAQQLTLLLACRSVTTSFSPTWAYTWRCQSMWLRLRGSWP